MTAHPVARTVRRAGLLAGTLIALGSLAACGSSAPSSSATSAASSPSSSRSSAASGSPTSPNSVAGSACQQVEADLAQAPTQLAAAATNPKGAQAQVAGFEHKLNQDAAGGSSALRTAVAQFAAAVQQSLQSAAAGHPPDIVGLTKQATQIDQLCAGGSPTPSP